MIRVEICINCDSQQPIIESVGAARQGGATTVELCSAMHEDGLTPRIIDMVQAKEHFATNKEIMVMIRPRAGGFSYSTSELQQMHRQIATAAEAGADGVVFGVLTHLDNCIDRPNLQKLLTVCRHYQLKTTFHRAFDATPRPLEALKICIDLGVDRILTSGTRWQDRLPAIDGVKTLEQLLVQANGRIEIVIGGGVTVQNVGQILRQLPADGQPLSVHAYSGVQTNGAVTAAAVRALVNATNDNSIA